MGLAEDSRKVHRIVEGSEAGLRQLYATPLAVAQQDWRLLQPAAAAGGDTWVQDDSPAAAAQLAAALPAHVLERLAAPLRLPPLPPLPAAALPHQLEQQGQQHRHLEQLASLGHAFAALDRRRRAKVLRHAIHTIVGNSSKRQAVSGLLMAGLLKSVRYGFAKLRKAWR